MTDDIGLTRRKILASVGAVGAAGGAAGMGTSALFSDEESVENNSITAGTTNLQVEMTLVEASNPSLMDINFTVDESRLGDGTVRTGVQVGDIKPGDYIIICTDVRVQNNPMYVAAQARNVVSSENAADTPDEFTDGSDPGELETNAEVTFGWDDGTPNDNSFGGSIATSGGSAPEFEGTLEEFLQYLQGGVLYRGDGSGPNPVGHAVDSSVPATKIGQSNADTTNVTHYTKIEIPKSVGNEIQGDSIGFDLVWNAEQARNNSDPESLTPTSIQTWQDLDDVRNGLSGDYVLINDLDQTTADYGSVASASANGGSGFEPIGGDGSAFTGTFDGNGNEIRDLVIDTRPFSFSDPPVGLFGVTDGAEISNVSLSNFDITGVFSVGTLAGKQNGDTGTIEDVHAEGSVTGFAGVGGLAGKAWGTIRDSSAHVTVSRPGGFGPPGGTFNAQGGLVGFLSSTGSIIRSYASGNVDGDARPGGLVGELDGSVRDAYALGDVEGATRIGGFSGINGTNANVDRVYTAAGNVDKTTTNPNIGGFTGEQDGTVTDGYWDEQESNQTDAVGDGSASGITALQTADMQGGSATSNMGGLDFSNTWETVEASDSDATGNGYPILQALPRERQLEAQGINS